jgi:nitric oxide reductase large subunit
MEEATGSFDPGIVLQSVQLEGYTHGRETTPKHAHTVFFGSVQ